MKSKTIIISSPNKSGRGILTLYEEDDLLKCKLRLYDMEKLNRYAKIGIYHNNEVYTANLLERSGVYESSLVGNFDMNADFYSAIINTSNNEVLLSGGTYAGFYFNNTSIFEENTNKPESDILTPNFSNNFDKNEEKEKNKPNLKDDECDKCATCKYKEYFYNSNVELFGNANNNGAHLISQDEQNSSKNAKNLIENAKKIENFEKNEQNLIKNSKILNNSQLDASNENNNENNNNNKNENNESENENKKSGISSVLEQIIPQFNYIFENYPANSELNSLIENSKFVTINNENYSLGAIFKDDQIEYICYALKCKYNTPPPEELGNYHQWLPLDREDPLSDGYYLVFQDAKDLKIIKV